MQDLHGRVSITATDSAAALVVSILERVFEGASLKGPDASKRAAIVRQLSDEHFVSSIDAVRELV